MDRLHEVDIKKGQKADKEKELKNTMEGGSPSQQQKLRVCEVCSAYLSIFDSDRRLADHFGGKMHLGYLKIRDLLKELKEKNRDQVATAVPDLRDEGRKGLNFYFFSERRHYDRRSRSKSPDRRSSGYRRRSRSPPRRRH
ncbi:104_t:CDS:2 [Entrophospora sp. SA101]|nr:104_t:CDS:2 [Entrophospora sp. SA101]